MLSTLHSFLLITIDTVIVPTTQVIGETEAGGRGNLLLVSGRTGIQTQRLTHDQHQHGFSALAAGFLNLSTMNVWC